MSSVALAEPHRGPMLLEVVREHIRARHFSRKTDKSYTHWISRFVHFHHKKHPRDMGALEVEAFLTDLAVNGKVSAATQTQVLSAFLFLYREVLIRWAKRRPRRFFLGLGRGNLSTLPLAPLSAPCVP